MNVWIQWGEAGNSDVASQEIELWNTVPDIPFGWKLFTVSIVNNPNGLDAWYYTMSMMKTLGAME